MDSRDGQDKGQDGCCSDSSCCPPSSDTGAGTSGCCSPEADGESRAMLGLRSIIFIVVIAAAVGIAAWSLIKTRRTEADIQVDGQYEELLDSESVSRSDLDSPYSLHNLAPEKDFAFLLLAGTNPEEESAATSAIERTSVTLAGRGIEAAAITIETDNPRYEDMADVFEVAAFPAVVLLGGGCGARVVSGDITEDELLKGYVQAACATGCGPSGCGPDAAKSGCCPGQ